jgi:hypothetical protein
MTGGIPNVQNYWSFSFRRVVKNIKENPIGVNTPNVWHSVNHLKERKWMEKKWEEAVREKLEERGRGTTWLKQSNKGRIESKTLSTDLVASICRTGHQY